MLNFIEGLVFGLMITLGTIFVARKLAPKKTYFDLHKDEKTSTPDHKGLE